MPTQAKPDRSAPEVAVLQAARRSGLVALDTYERTVRSWADLQTRLAESTESDWLIAVTGAQADFTRELTAAYAGAARGVLERS